MHSLPTGSCRPNNTTNSRLRHGGKLASVFVLALATACGGDEAEPTIEQFSATPLTVVSGGRVTLSWTVKDSDRIQITAMPGGEVVSATTLTGTQMSEAITQNTTFVLTASKGDKQATRSVMVSVASANAPVVDSFTVTPGNIRAGDSTTLRWETTNAATVDIATDSGRMVVTAGQGDGSMEDSPAQTTTYTLTAKAADGTSVTAMVTVMVTGDTAPMVTSFTAMPNVITRGQPAVLRWTITGDNLEITIRGGQTMVYEGSAATGMVTVMPTDTTTYTLNVENGAGTDQDTVTINVNPPEGARVVSFAANPTAVTWGVSSVLSWEAGNADRIEITAGATVVHRNNALTGMFTVTPTVTTDYLLTAFNTNGNAMAMTRVTFNPTAPVIRSFSATPIVLPRGDQTMLAWQTLGANRVRILRNGVVTATVTTSPNMATVSVAATATVNVFTLEATNQTGTNMQSVTVYGHDAPEIEAFTASPTAFIGTATVTVTWGVTSISSLQLLGNGQAIAGFPLIRSSTAAITSTGTFSMLLNTTTVLRLVATSTAGSVTRDITVYARVGETEPNNDFMTATPAPGTDVQVTGSITPAGDNDYYAITVPNGGNVTAQTSDGMGGCPFDTTLQLLAPDGTTQIAFNDDAVGTCSRIAPATIPAASNLAAGTYYLRVRHFSATGTGNNYVLSVQIGSPTCGNALIETRANEQCDDGNAVAGDGCSATCTVEPQGMVMGPAAPTVVTTFTGAIDPATRRNFYQITMAAAGYIDVDTYSPAVGQCVGADTRVALLDSNFNLLGEDNDDGAGLCARIDAQFDAFAAVPAGTYWVRVEENGNNAVIPSYGIRIRTLGQGCGNSIIESAAPLNEVCDDGNSVAGDGCSETCTFEGLTENEAGGNNAYNAAGVVTINPTGLAGSFTIQGSISPAGDSDYYAIQVPAGHHVDAFLTVGSLTGCPVTPEGRVRFYGTNGTTVLATDDFSGPDGNCGRVYPRNDVDTFNRPAGTYFLQVVEDSSPAVAMPIYFLHVQIIAPACGNTYLEPGEVCDDGNTAINDGCSATCTFEPVNTVTLPRVGTATISGAVVPAYARIPVQVNVTATTYIRAETFAPNIAAGCPTDDTVLRLFAADGTTQLGTDDQDGPGSCSLINPITDSFARLTAGTYWLTVEDFGNNSEIAAFQVAIRSIAADVCGNGIREATANESCDDGNLAAGDGCSATCTVEPEGMYAGPGAPMTFTGAITPVGDTDLFQVTLSAESYLFAETFDNAVARTCTSDTVIRLFNASGTQLGEDDEDGVNSCSRFGATDAFARLLPGTYFVQVEDYLNNGTITTYDLVLEARAVNVCGNGVIETGETCDDANLVNGDGCSNLCASEIPITTVAETEPNDTPAAPQALGTLPVLSITDVTAAIGTATDEDWFSFTLTASTRALINTYGTAGQVLTTCPGDTQLWLYNGVPTNLTTTSVGAAEPTLVAYDDDDGFGTCSLINGNENAPIRVTLPAGTYYLRAREYNLGGLIPAYRIRIDLLP